MNKKEENLRTELKRYKRRGIRLLLNGYESTPRAIEKACTVEEEKVYMRDYIQDEKGRVSKISFDIVEKRRKNLKKS